MLGSVDVQRVVDRLGEAMTERDRGALVDVLADDHELVPAEPGHGVRGPDGRHQPPAEADQQRVAGRVAVEVIDRLEPVEVDEQHARHARIAPGARERVDQPLTAQRAVGKAGERVMERVVAHPLLPAQPPERGREDVRDAAQEVLLLLAEVALDADRAEDLVADGDLEAGRLVAVRAPRGERHAVVEHGNMAERERLAHPLDRLQRQVGDVRAGQRAGAQRRHRGLLARLALQARHRLAVGGHVAPDGQQQRPGLGLDDPPAHLADELRPVAPQAVRTDGEAQRMLGLEVQVHVARVARPDALRPEGLDRLTDQLVVFVSEQRLRQRIGEHDPPVPPGGDRRVGQALEHGAQRGLAPAQARLHLRHVLGFDADGRKEQRLERARIPIGVCVLAQLDESLFPLRSVEQSFLETGLMLGVRRRAVAAALFARIHRHGAGRTTRPMGSARTTWSG